MIINRKISDRSAFIAIMVIGLVIALVTINIGEKIVAGSENAAAEKNKQIEKELDNI